MMENNGLDVIVESFGGGSAPASPELARPFGSSGRRARGPWTRARCAGPWTQALASQNSATTSPVSGGTPRALRRRRQPHRRWRVDGTVQLRRRREEKFVTRCRSRHYVAETVPVPKIARSSSGS